MFYKYVFEVLQTILHNLRLINYNEVIPLEKSFHTMTVVYGSARYVV